MTGPAPPHDAQFLDASEVAGLCTAAGFGPASEPACPPCPPCPPAGSSAPPAHYPPAERFYRQFAAGILAVAVLGYLAAYVQWGLAAWCRRARAPAKTE